MCAHYGARKPARARVRESTHASVRGCAHIRARGSAHVVVRVREEAHTVYQISQS